MCGIAGVIRKNCESAVPLTDKVMMISKLLKHRGPDDSGYLFVYCKDKSERRCSYVEAFDDDTLNEATKDKVFVKNVEEDWCIALHNRRLSILDPTVTGHQPFSNEDKTVWLVFNGEIYNFHELRKELITKGHEFICDCDTEVIVHGYEEWWMQGFLRRARGMWAFALVDLNKLKLYLVRDYFGIKPLYYAEMDDIFVFASEIKALKLFRHLEPDKDAILKYLLYLPMGTTQTFYRGVKRLAPSSYLEFDLMNNNYQMFSYWQPPLSSSSDLTYRKAVARWREAFLESIKIHLRSDFPIAFLLSGGLDSSSIAVAWKYLRDKGALERWASKGTPIAVTFSHGGSRDETKYALRLAEELGIELKVVSVEQIEELWEELPKIVYYHDEPPYGPSIIAEWFVMKEASRYVKVVISGQGGDELLAGYQRYVYRYLLQLLKSGRILRFLSELWRFRDLLLEKQEYFLFLRKIKKLRRKFKYLTMAGHGTRNSHKDFLNNMLLNDLLGEGLQRLLHNADRDSMAFSLEARVPFLDVSLAELSLHYPDEYKLSSGWTKRIHRDALKGILPDYIRLRRSKIGFEAPESRWLKELTKKKLVDWNQVISALSNNNIPEEILSIIKSLIEKLLTGKPLNQAEANYLWRILFIYIWLKLIFKDLYP